MDVSTTLAAFLTGLGTSLHCSVMCGPLACAFRVNPLEYHLSRIISYTAAGALCGGLGQLIHVSIKTGPLHFAPWLLLLVLVLIATGLDRRIPLPNFILSLGARLRFQRTLGLLTPLIPCGPLWLILGVAVSTASARTGASFLFYFALGTIPLALALQLGFQQLQKIVKPQNMVLVQRSIIWCAVGILAWRLWLPSPNGCCTL